MPFSASTPSEPKPWQRKISSWVNLPSLAMCCPAWPVTAKSCISNESSVLLPARYSMPKSLTAVLRCFKRGEFRQGRDDLHRHVARFHVAAEVQGPQVLQFRQVACAQVVEAFCTSVSRWRLRQLHR